MWNTSCSSSTIVPIAPVQGLTSPGVDVDLPFADGDRVRASGERGRPGREQEETRDGESGS
jgi:hypothetical protein